MDLIAGDELAPLFQVLQAEADMTFEESQEVFAILFVYVHGYASMFANNEMVYDESALIGSLEKVLSGAVYAVKENIT